MTRRLVLLAVLIAPALASAQPRSVPVIYCTDLFHPHDDPDDHFDLATLFATEEFDVRAIILDQGAQQLARPGSTPIRQLCAITGREVPHAIGLDEKLTSLEDTGVSRPAQFQAGVELLLRVLRESERPVTIVQTGSLRDLAAAYNRDPQLLRRKVARLYVNSGNAAGAQFEYNAQLDMLAFRRVMESALPVYWCPCFGGDRVWSGGPHGAWWQFEQSALLDRLSPPLLSYFAYAHLRLPTTVDPLKAIRRPGLLPLISDQWRSETWAQTRSMWSTASLLHAAGKTVKRTPQGEWRIVRLSDTTPEPVFSFAPTTWEFDEGGGVTLRPDEQTTRRVLTVNDPEAYPQAMLAALEQLLRNVGRSQP